MKQKERINYGNERIEIKFTDRAGMLNPPENPAAPPGEVPEVTPTEIPDPQPPNEIPLVNPVEIPEVNPPLEIPQRDSGALRY